MATATLESLLPRNDPIGSFWKSATQPQARKLGASTRTAPQTLTVRLANSNSTRVAGARIVTDDGPVVDVLLPDAYIVAVHVYQSADTAPQTRDDLMSYFNTRSIVGDTFGDLCQTIANGLTWEGSTICRETSVSTERRGQELVLTTHDGAKESLRAIVDLSADFALQTSYNTAAPGQPPTWVPVSSDFTTTRKLATEFNDGVSTKQEYSTFWSRQAPPKCRYIGFGERGGEHVCMNGASMMFMNAENSRAREVYHNGPLDSREPLNHSCPFWIEFTPDHPAVGVFLDTVSPSFVDLSRCDEGRIEVGTLLSHFNYYVVVQDTSRDVVQLYCRLVGQGRLYPRWVLGYHQGKTGWRTAEDVERCASKFRNAEIPIDSFNIDTDLQDEFRPFAVSSRFSGIYQLHRYGLKAATTLAPFIPETPSLTGEKLPEIFVPDCYAGDGSSKPALSEPLQPFHGQTPLSSGRTGGLIPELSLKKASAWWQEQCDGLIKDGLDYVCTGLATPGMGATADNWMSFPFSLLVADNSTKKQTGGSYLQKSSPTHAPRSPAITTRNLFALNAVKSTSYGWERHYLLGEKRPFVLARGGCAGTHRFGALHTGENASSWEFLRTNLVQCLNIGLTGQHICGSDVGGYARDNEGHNWADPELVIRWHLAACLLPWYSNQYDGRKPGKEFQEIWAYNEIVEDPRVPEGQKFLYKNVLPVCKYYIELRYRLMQLLYDASFNAVRTGIPVARPMFLQDGHDPRLTMERIDFNDSQYFVGSDLLVAPFIWKGEESGRASRDVYLPSGSLWYQFKNCFAPLDPETRHRLQITPDVKNPQWMSLGWSMNGRSILARFDASIHSDLEDYSYNLHIPFILPMFVRGGAVIPTVELEQYVGERREQGKQEPVTINVFPSGSSTYDLYIDDDSRAACPVRGDFDKRRGCADEYYRFSVSNKQEGKSWSVSLTCGHCPTTSERCASAMPRTKWLCLAFLKDRELADSLRNVVTLTVNGVEQSVTTVASIEEFYNGAGDKASLWTDSTINATYVRFGTMNVPRQKGKSVTVTLA